MLAVISRGIQWLVNAKLPTCLQHLQHSMQIKTNTIKIKNIIKKMKKEEKIKCMNISSHDQISNIEIQEACVKVLFEFSPP